MWVGLMGGRTWYNSVAGMETAAGLVFAVCNLVNLLASIFFFSPHGADAKQHAIARLGLQGPPTGTFSPFSSFFVNTTRHYA